MESKFLIPLGSEINVYKSKIKTDLPQALLTKLPSEIIAKVIDYKMTDGNGIGYVLMTESKLKIWIFSNELNDKIKDKYSVDDLSYNENIAKQGTVINQYIGELDLNGDYKISYLINPINFVKWSLYTLKDVF